jgi:hypothetical protein
MRFESQTGKLTLTETTMKRSYRLLALGLALCLGLAAAVQARAEDKPANVAGTWNLTLSSQRGTFNSTLALKQDGSKVTGTITGRMGETPIDKGAVAGDTLTFEVTRETPNGTFTMSYKATVNGDSMKGTGGNDRFSFEFTGKRGGDSSDSKQQ